MRTTDVALHSQVFSLVFREILTASGNISNES
jgi:hypothetical protein